MLIAEAILIEYNDNKKANSKYLRKQRRWEKSDQRMRPPSIIAGHQAPEAHSGLHIHFFPRMDEK